MPRNAAADSFPVSGGGVQNEAAYRILPHFLTPAEADALLGWLLGDVEWRRESVRLFGREREVPRLVAWFGDAGRCYRYSGVDHLARGWPKPVAALRERVAGLLPAAPNFALLNRYRDGADCLGWHTDAEPMACDQLASLSLGARRRFLLRAAPDRPSVRLNLGHGCLLLFDRHLPHSLPRTKRACGERVNVSFRVLP